ncbi:unnamed protein product [Ambrosiozyma monospora]|uniref:Unnamed protein product n=1 Tax=Ambrosiozyma monospora TaxID=43982 RepID=A0ACB5T506_AMBMO|nr:unnamed protein product [Ambrosiozyma monospora]
MLAKSIFTTALLTLSTIASAGEVALYWGQAGGGSQESLGSYCAKGDADIFILSFMNTFSGSSMGLNFASACNTASGKCEQIGTDIKACQKLGKKVFLSLGGAAGTYGFSSDAEAEGFAGTLWNTFGAGTGKSIAERPFGDAIVDGFDFDIENQRQTGYAALATKLREYYGAGASTKYFISAAPQCVWPDQSVGDLLARAYVDYAFVQFYNNPCAVSATFNWDTWANYAKTAPNKNIKIFLGLPGSTAAATTGFVDLTTITNTVNGPIAANNANFGGIMLWDASSAYTANPGFVGSLAQLVHSTGSSAATYGQRYAVDAEKFLPSGHSEVSYSESGTAYPAASSSSIDVETLYNTESPASISAFAASTVSNAQDYTTSAPESDITVTSEPTVIPYTPSIPADLTTLLTVYTSTADDLYKRSNNLAHKHHQH